MGWKKGVRGIVSLSNWKEGTVIYQDGGRLQEDQVWGNGRYLSHNHSEVWPWPGTHESGIKGRGLGWRHLVGSCPIERI